MGLCGAPASPSKGVHGGPATNSAIDPDVVSDLFFLVLALESTFLLAELVSFGASGNDEGPL